ncbi:MAG TPA: PEP-CTERM sorting domain-containing protein [Steroidobacteraceae bacterium]|nr:PEP-CTERM sorting domain-containing protein [Steroidobacteraceae bacterium]HUN73310.1 PEP-CTERM sorting domain-containing protein [Steroidobacteraceae bacterium]
MTQKNLVRAAAVLTCLAAGIACGLAHASTLSVTYYEVSSSDPSYGTLCCGTYDNEVLSTLGPNGLPQLNPGYSGTMPSIQDVYNGQLTWWSPSLNSHVTETGTGTVTLPIDDTSNFYPPNGTGTNDYSGGLTALYTGTIDVPTTEQISFSIGADDSAFAYLDGQIVCDLGGVHGFANGTCTSGFDISAGSHTLELFYDDMDPSQAGLYFSITTAGVTSSGGGGSVPEPDTLALLGAGMLGAGLALSRRRRAR